MIRSRVLEDLRGGLRHFGAEPVQSIFIVLLLASGIGANLAIFSALDVAFLRPLPYPDGDRLVVIQMQDASRHQAGGFTSYPVYEAWRQHATSFSGLTAFLLSDATLTGSDRPRLIQTAQVQSEFFSVAAVSPALGRCLTSEDERDGNDAVVVLSHSLWTSAFGGARDVLSRTMLLDGRSHTIVGVMPVTFRFPERSVELWRPLIVQPGMRTARLAFWASVVGRLKPDATAALAEAQMRAIMTGLGERFPDMKRYGVTVRTLRAATTGDSRQALLLLQGAVCCVLFIACANVAGLLLLRGERRQHEMATRTAIGATRGQLVAQVVAEASVLASAGGVLGLLIGRIAVQILIALSPAELSVLGSPTLNARLIAFDVILVFATVLASTLVPAFRAARPDVSSLLGRRMAGAPRRRRSVQTRSVLVAAECALAVVLLVCTGVFVRTLLNISQADRGFSHDRVMTAAVRIAPNTHRDPQALLLACDRLVEELSQIPGVSAAGATQLLLFNQYQTGVRMIAESRQSAPAHDQPEASVDPASTNYFRALSTPLLKGRVFETRDGPDAAPVALVNQTAAARAWPGEDPIGKRFALGKVTSKTKWITVVGVVADMHRGGVERAVGAQVFVPLTQMPSYGLTVVVRSSGEPERVVGALREAIWKADKDTAVWDVRPLADLLDESVAVRRFQTTLLSIFALAALALACLGVFALAHGVVTVRAPELGVRRALGAPGQAIVRLVVWDALRPVVIGVTLGAAASIAVSSVFSAQLFGVRPWDPLTLLAVASGVLVVAVGATIGAARRAGRLDPLIVMRCL
jgi:predicted permease